MDSLECSRTASRSCNTSCVEPVNFAYLQTNGVPGRAARPQLTDVST